MHRQVRKHLAVDLIAYLRPEVQFDSLDALKTQMAKDSDDARAALDRALSRC